MSSSFLEVNCPVAETGPVTLLNPVFICMKSRELTHLHPHVPGRFEPNSQDENLAGSRHQPATRSAPAVPECSTCLENVVNVSDISITLYSIMHEITCCWTA